jgi:hypothetical protein
MCVQDGEGLSAPLDGFLELRRANIIDNHVKIDTYDKDDLSQRFEALWSEER